MEKRFFNKVWFACGRISGFGIGFEISKYNASLTLGFWYIGLDY
jgi:hypothetical protein